TGDWSRLDSSLKGSDYRAAAVLHVDTDPLFPDDPYMSPNRRVTITLMREEPPLPDNLTP
ncbi:MAG: hypothetical protein WCB26_22435, partial [Pseudolabrys sp.]